VHLLAFYGIYPFEWPTKKDPKPTADWPTLDDPARWPTVD
jgi:hypothetical protein